MELMYPNKITKIQNQKQYEKQLASFDTVTQTVMEKRNVCLALASSNITNIHLHTQKCKVKTK